jgi:hypothetical protein
MPEYFYDMVSTRVVRAAYDRDSRRLYVRFKKPEKDGGTPWTYEDVPPKVWAKMLRVSREGRSLGKFVNTDLTPLGNYHRGTWNEL